LAAFCTFEVLTKGFPLETVAAHRSTSAAKQAAEKQLASILLASTKAIPNDSACSFGSALASCSRREQCAILH
jgi:hypothetical protein